MNKLATLAIAASFALASISLVSCGKHEFEDFLEDLENLFGSSSSAGEEEELSSSSSAWQRSSSSLARSSSSSAVRSSSSSSLARSSSSSSFARSSSSSSLAASSSSSAARSSSSEEITLDFTAAELQRISAIKAKYSGIQTNFAGGYFITAPSASAPYSAGKAKPEVLQAGLDATNLVRYIAGIPDDVELDDNYTDLAQHGAILLSVVDELNHYPAKPADMPQAFYDKGYEATANSNISYDTRNVPPSATVYVYMDDSDQKNIATVGHRRWILNPTMKKTGFGVDILKYGVMYSHDKSRSAVDYDYIAWPSPGVFPAVPGVRFFTNTAWSVTVNAQKYGAPDINKIEVALKHLNSGRTWAFSKNTPSSTAGLKAYFNIDRGGYGINNCIIFRPEFDSSFKYEEGDVFQVTVSGLDRELSYIVKMFSM